METHDGRTVWRRSSDSTLGTAYRRQQAGRELVGNASVFASNSNSPLANATEWTTRIHVKKQSASSFGMFASGIDVSNETWVQWNSGNTISIAVRNPNSAVKDTYQTGIVLDGSTQYDAVIVARFDNGTTTLWLNGENLGTGSANDATVSSNAHFQIGGVRNAGTNFPSDDEMRSIEFWTTALTDEQCAELADLGQNVDGVVAHYNFESPTDNIATTLLDSSGNGNHLTVTNGYAGMLADTGSGVCDLNELGWTDGTGSNGAAVGVRIPADKSNPTQDVYGNALQFSGRCEAAADVTGVSCFQGNLSAYADAGVSLASQFNGLSAATIIVHGDRDARAGVGLSASNRFSIGLNSSSSSYWSCGNGANTSGQHTTALNDLGDGWWALVFDGAGATDADKLKAFHNGVYVPFDVISGPIPATLPSGMTIAAICNDIPNVHDGRHDNVLWYTRVVTTGELLALANTGVRPSGYVENHVCCEGDGNIIHGVNGNHAIVTNSYSGQWGTTDTAPSHVQEVGAEWRMAGDGATGFITLKETQIPDVGRIECEVIPAVNALMDVFNHYNSSNGYFELDYGSTTKRFRFVAFGAPNLSITHTAVIEPGEKAAIVCTWDNTGSISLTINGVTETNTGAGWTTKTLQDWFVGKRWNDTQFWNGDIRYFRIYDAETGGNLIRHWPFNDGVDARWRARSYNGTDQFHQSGSDPNLVIGDTVKYFICGWIKPSAVPGGFGQGICQVGTEGIAGQGEATFFRTVDSSISFWPDGGGSINASGVAVVGEWAFFVGFYDSAEPTNKTQISARLTGGDWVRNQNTLERDSGNSADTFIVGGMTWSNDVKFTGDIGAIHYGIGTTKTLTEIEGFFWNGGRGIIRGELTDQQRADFGIVLENYGDETSGGRKSVTGADMTAVGSPGSTDGPRATQAVELVNGVPGTISGTVDRPHVPLASGATGDWMRGRETLNYQQTAGLTPWLQATSQEFVSGGSVSADASLGNTATVVEDDPPDNNQTKIVRTGGVTGKLAGSLIIPQSQPFTLCAWFRKRVGNSVQPLQIIFGQYQAGPAGRFLTYLHGTGTTPNELKIATSGSEALASGIAITDELWHFVVITSDGAAGSTMRVDNGSSVIGGGSWSTLLQVPLSFGADNVNANGLDGDLWNCRYYDRELTEQEQSEVYGFGGPTDGVIWAGSDDLFAYATNAAPISREFADATIINGKDRRAYEIMEADQIKDAMHYRDAITTGEHSNLINWQDARQ